LIDYCGCKRDVVTATIVAAEHDQAARAGGSHLAKGGDLLGPLHAQDPADRVERKAARDWTLDFNQYSAW